MGSAIRAVNGLARSMLELCQGRKTRRIMLLGGFGLALTFLAPPLTPGAQQAGKVWRIGLFHVGLDHVPPSLEPLRDGLRALGYEEGKNIRLDWRNLPDEEAALKTAREFVRDRVGRRGRDPNDPGRHASRD